MEGYIGEIRLFGGNYAPLGWQLCNGEIRSIAADTALYSIIGTIYGGDGISTFALPDLRGRVAMGNFKGPGLTARVLGEKQGSENVTLTIPNMAAHTHAAIVTPNQGQIPTATAKLYGVNDAGGNVNPGGNMIGTDSDAGATPYLATGPIVAMKSDSIVINSLNPPLPVVTLANTGGSMPHNNIQPILGLNFIICIEGIYPSRS
jgi:microcystin-dependent protein